ncbi:MAG: hypothetical protein OQK09_10885 [Colwellia sp.]|nr:hypothetical protein [Colwellia sp.]MCW8865440.1 hypothetical protein [Colwellia sp.]MCW9082005.1 hypothetical protein [Colwellia sp.]
MNTVRTVISILLISILVACGGDSESPQVVEPTASPPTISISVDSFSVDEGSTIQITSSATDHKSTEIAVNLLCDIGSLDGNNYTAPSVPVETVARCTATATDSDNRTTTEALTLTINAVTPVLALANGETSATTAKLTTINVNFADITEGVIDATLNGKAIKFAVTADKQLVYFPPMGATGLQSLELTIEGEVVTYEYQAQDSSATFGDAEIYINEYFTKTKFQIDEIIQNKLASNALPEEIELLNTFKDTLSLSNEVFSSLTSDELEYFAQIIFENNNFFESVLKPASFYKTSSPSLNVSNRLSLTECESEAFHTTIYVTSSVALIGASAVLISSGAGAPLGLISGLAVISSVVIWADHIEDTIALCFEPFETYISSFIPGRKSKISSYLNTSKVNDGNSLTFFSHEEKTFTVQTQNQYLAGAEGFVTTIIGGYNSLLGKLNWLFDLAGRGNIPDYVENTFVDELSVIDYLFTDITPNNLSISSLTDDGVTGDITNRNENNSLDMTFSIEDLDVPHIAFQFTITDSGHDTPLNTVIDAEVTLNPPEAYDATYVTDIGDELIGMLQADFETGFEIKTQPAQGTLILTNPDSGLFVYTADDTLHDETEDSFTFVATNGSEINNGESNTATVNIEIKPQIENTPPTVSVLGAYDKLTKDDPYEGINSTNFYLELDVADVEGSVRKYYVDDSGSLISPTIESFHDFPENEWQKSIRMVPVSAEIQNLSSASGEDDALRATNIWNISVWVADDRDEISLVDTIQVNYGHKSSITLPFYDIPFVGDPPSKWYDTLVAMDMGPSAPQDWDGIEHYVYVTRTDYYRDRDVDRLRVNTREDAPENGTWWYHFYDSNVTSIAYFNFYDSNNSLICTNSSFTSYHANWWCYNEKILIEDINTLVVTYSH